MGIFRRNQIDLSDEGLALAAEDSNVIKEAAADEGQTNIRDHSSAVNSLAAAGGLSTEDDLPAQETGQELEEQQPALSAEQKAEREALWQEAAASVAASWPQAMGQGQQLIAKMVEISQRYGDAQLWQRVPAGIMREAALEEMNRRNQAKAGLEKRRGRQTHPPALTEEEKIIEQISQARGGSIF